MPESTRIVPPSDQATHLFVCPKCGANHAVSGATRKVVCACGEVLRVQASGERTATK